MIYCGYQGCGKSTYCRNNPDTTIDLDSSNFVKKDKWEYLYVALAHSLSFAGYNVFISAHQVVINRLIEEGIVFELLIPEQNPKAWRNRLEFRYNINPTQANMNAILDFDKNYEKDMAFYETLTCKKHYISARIVTDIDTFIKQHVKCYLIKGRGHFSFHSFNLTILISHGILITSSEGKH